jgi:hypothetical protein
MELDPTYFDLASSRIQSAKEEALKIVSDYTV